MITPISHIEFKSEQEDSDLVNLTIEQLADMHVHDVVRIIQKYNLSSYWTNPDAFTAAKQIFNEWWYDRFVNAISQPYNCGKIF